MNGKIFNTEITLDSIENHLNENNVTSRVIYLLVIFIIAALFVAICFIKVDISVQGVGLIRPGTEKTEIRSLISEVVENTYVLEGDYTEKGDTILVFNAYGVNSKITFIESELNKLNKYTNDLLQLISNIETPELKTKLYTSEFVNFNKKMYEVQTRVKKAKKEIDRNKNLKNKGIISDKEYDDLVFSYNKLKNEEKVIISNQKAEWENELERYNTQLLDLTSQYSQINKEHGFYIVTAPISGTIEEFSGIYPGSFLQAGQPIAVISPETNLISEVFVSPKDIGYMKDSNRVKIQVDAFNYNEWGVLNGYIKNISDDFFLVDDQAVFKVRCTMDKDYLELKNGVIGKLKKGMTIRARFVVARKSIFQLLYQGIDDWINPVQYNNKTD